MRMTYLTLIAALIALPASHAMAQDAATTTPATTIQTPAQIATQAHNQATTGAKARLSDTRSGLHNKAQGAQKAASEHKAKQGADEAAQKARIANKMKKHEADYAKFRQERDAKAAAELGKPRSSAGSSKTH